MEPASPQPDDRRAFALAAGALWTLAAALIVLLPVLPLQDGPTHLALLHARERVLAGDAHYLAWFQTWPISSIYWLCYRALILFAQVLSWEGALRAFLLCYLAAWAGALWLLLGREPGRRWWALLAAPLVFNGVFLFGFLNTLVIYPLSACSLAFLSRGEPARGARSRLALGGLAVAMVLVHPAGWAQWTLIALPLAFALHQGPWRGRVKEALPLLAPLLALPLLMMLQSGEAGPGERPPFNPDPQALLRGDLEQGLDADWQLEGGPFGVLAALFPYSAGPRHLMILALGVGLVAAVRWPREGRGREQTIFLRAALAVLLLSPLLPFRLGFSAFFNVRVLPWALLLLLCALPRELALRPRVRPLIAAIGALLLAVIAWPCVRYAQEASQLLALAREQPARRTVLPVFLSIRSPWFPGCEHNLHLPSLLQLRQDWLHPYLWSEGAAPLRYLKKHDVPESAYRSSTVGAAQVRAYELVLVACDPDDPEAAEKLPALLAGPLAGWTPVDRRGVWSLFSKPEVVEPHRSD